jgi:hypothetical protein
MPRGRSLSALRLRMPVPPSFSLLSHAPSLSVVFHITPIMNGCSTVPALALQEGPRGGKRVRRIRWHGCPERKFDPSLRSRRYTFSFPPPPFFSPLPLVSVVSFLVCSIDAGSGVLRATLFDEFDHPVAERLVLLSRTLLSQSFSLEVSVFV